jgi:hypothetical protein
MLNALGNAVAPTEFKDVAHAGSLRGIAPWNIVGARERQPLPGHGRLFPKVQARWNERRKLIDEIAEHHDVSKREFIDATARLGLEDARATMPLKEYEFRNRRETSVTDSGELGGTRNRTQA